MEKLEKLKIDKTKLITVTNYAYMKGLSRQAIYLKAKRGELKLTEIDGVKFIDLTDK